MLSKTDSPFFNIISRVIMLCLLIVAYLLVIKPISLTLHEIVYEFIEVKIEGLDSVDSFQESRGTFKVLIDDFEPIPFHAFGNFLFLVPAAILIVLYRKWEYVRMLLYLYSGFWLIQIFLLNAAISGLSFLYYVCGFLSQYMIAISLFYLIFVFAKEELPSMIKEPSEVSEV